MLISSESMICIGLVIAWAASKYPNMILTMHSLPQLPGALQLAGNLIGKTIFVNWPMMHETKVSVHFLLFNYLNNELNILWPNTDLTLLLRSWQYPTLHVKFVW